MKAGTVFTLFGLIVGKAIGQDYTSSSIFAHNDYAQPNPFYDAYTLRVGYVEADIFLKDDQLFVAHHQNEIKNDRTLERMYFNPIKKEISNNKGWAYPDTTLQLKLMIDLKTEGIPTLHKLVAQLKSFPELITAKGFEIFISGNVPSPERWDEFPFFINFDGRPGIQYSPNQLKRITLISSGFGTFSKWDGKGDLSEKDKNRIDSLIKVVHSLEKKIRFWSTPDFENGWKTLCLLNVDIIGTDHVPELVQFISQSARSKESK
jgi:alkaline phosphatase